MRLFWGGLCLLLLHASVAQSIEGRIVDSGTGESLPGATVKIVGTETGTTADEGGYFVLNELDPGRYQLEVSFVGFRTARISNILVRTGKIEKVNFELDSKSTELEGINVVAPYSSVSPGRRTITEEQINRYAASYYDPARLMTTSPDVMISNDQNNEVSVRGISPDYNVWRLEGAEIVNPNHLSNAGTFNDQPAGTSGGVNILSAQMLGPSSLEFGSSSNVLSNSIGGIFDMSLKEGTSSDHQFTTQASVIGFDLSAEGPLKKGSSASFITNYRYSFTGLLTSAGVDFGGESIGFQDLAATINLPFKNTGGVKLFGVGGTSFNNFDHLPFTESEREKDRKDIYYDGRMGLLGATYDFKGFRAVVVGSGFRNRREENVYDDMDALDSGNVVRRDESVLSTHLSYTLSVDNTTYRLGVINNFYQYGNIDQSLSQIYFDTKTVFSGISIDAGVTLSSNEMDTTVFDPRISLTWAVGPKFDLYLGGGRYSQLLKPSNFYFASLFQGDDYVLRPGYPFIFSNRYTLGGSYELASTVSQLEFFYYTFDDVNFSDESEARSYGASFTTQRDFVGQWYFLAGANVFESKIGQDINNPFDLGYSLNASGGKGFSKVKKGIPRSLDINIRLTWQGGRYFQEPLTGDPGSLTLIPYGRQLPDYIRTDLRVQWTKSRPKMTRIVAIDLQNALFRENVGFYYYDNFLNSDETSYQLGLVPIITYRLEF